MTKTDKQILIGLGLTITCLGACYYVNRKFTSLEDNLKSTRNELFKTHSYLEVVNNQLVMSNRKISNLESQLCMIEDRQEWGFGKLENTTDEIHAEIFKPLPTPNFAKYGPVGFLKDKGKVKVANT